MTSRKNADPSQFDWSDFFPFVLNRLAERMCLHVGATYLKKHGLTIPEWRVLANLAVASRMSARDIGVRANMEKSKVSRAIKSLSERKLLAQHVAADDRRSKNLKLTAKGKRLYEAVLPELLDWEANMLEGMSASRKKDVMACLNQINEYLDELD